MSASDPQQITQLLLAWGQGDEAARDQLIPMIYDELRRLARKHLRRERPGHTLQTLAQMSPQQSRIVELRFFGGLTIEETAEVLGISHATVEREWRVARAWLWRELQKK